MNIQIRQAEVRDTERVSSVLIEAADWLRERGIPMWRADELSPDRIDADVVRGDFFVAEVGEEIVGTAKFQLKDDLLWPDVPADEAAFVHRLAVRRSYAGGHISGLLLRWAADRARRYCRRFLRLDCDAGRPRLSAVYERFGFRYHSNRQVGPYLVARYERELQ
jgi:GNAT superfamily N-acetyltransferase